MIRQKVVVYDLHGKQDENFTLPQIEGYTPWLYIFDGLIESHGETLHKGDAITGDIDELTNITLLEDTTIVLFFVNLNAKMTFTGNYSGVKRLG